MTENTENDDLVINPEPTEMDVLKERAKTLGIDIRGNISVETLKQRIQAKLTDAPEPPSNDNPEPNPGNPYGNANGLPPQTLPQAAPVPQKSKQQLLNEYRQQQLAEQTKLVRVRVACLNPLKAQLQGEIFTVANDLIGTHKKFVPFGEATDNGYHVPLIILNEMRARRFNQVTVKKEGATELPISRLVPEFSIEVLEPLTQEELNQLARQQAAAAGL